MSSFHHQLTYFPQAAWGSMNTRGGMVEEDSFGGGDNVVLMSTGAGPRSAPSSPELQKSSSHSMERAPTPSPPSAGPQPTVRKSFSSSPIFLKDVITKDGKASVTLPFPDNLGTWHVLVMGITKNSRFGVTTKDVIARKTVNLVPSMLA
eukprot:gene19167-6463_t